MRNPSGCEEKTGVSGVKYVVNSALTVNCRTDPVTRASQNRMRDPTRRPGPKPMKSISAVLLLFALGWLPPALALDICDCRGYRGPGGPCDSSLGGAAYAGPGGPASAGPEGRCFAGLGGPRYAGQGGPFFAGPGGSRYAGLGGPAYAGPGGPEESGPNGRAYQGPGGLADTGPGGACYAGPNGPCYAGPGGSGEGCSKLCR